MQHCLKKDSILREFWLQNGNWDVQVFFHPIRGWLVSLEDRYNTNPEDSFYHKFYYRYEQMYTYTINGARTAYGTNGFIPEWEDVEREML
jgi:hypothetical protein